MVNLRLNNVKSLKRCCYKVFAKSYYRPGRHYRKKFFFFSQFSDVIMWHFSTGSTWRKGRVHLPQNYFSLIRFTGGLCGWPSDPFEGVQTNKDLREREGLTFTNFVEQKNTFMWDPIALGAKLAHDSST